jgi:hypothetical protein
MDFSAESFVQEFARIKLAADDSPEHQSRWKPLAKNVLQSIGAGAIGGGLGTAAGYSAAEILKRYSPLGKGGPLSPRALSTLRTGSGLIGGLGGIATMIALNKAQRRYEDEKTRGQQ